MDANHAIREGIIIAGKWTWARQIKKEPRRCLRCQWLTVKHLAADCKQQVTCRTCSKEHHMVECTET